MTPRPALTVRDAWDARVAAAPDATALVYFDARLSARETDRIASSLAAALAARGVGKGDRVGIHLQNTPQFPLVLLALWKLGAAGLLLNPMYFGRELRQIVDDAEPIGIIATDVDAEKVRTSVDGSSAGWVVSACAADLQSRDDPRVFSVDRVEPSPDGDLGALISEYTDSSVPSTELTATDVALLTYTSGTTGPPKGAMNSHGNVLAVATSFAEFGAITAADTVFSLAPLFHITGVVLLGALPLVTGAALVCTGRFAVDVALDALREHRVTYTIGSITAFIAMMNSPVVTRDHFASIRVLFSGGAPVSPSTVQRFQELSGHYIHNAYGMTETTSGVIAVPPGSAAPVDAHGTLSVGVPLPGVHAEVVAPDDTPVAPGAEGELVLSGPQIVSGYWRNPEATAATMPEGRLHTGDSAVVDADGWVYIVDRIKDQINVSGYKVWPREVEDVLYEHPAVLEAAVVGVADDYQGEAVAAFVSVRDGHRVDGDELVAFARERLAPYKRPKTVAVVDQLPKTQTGKIQRRVLREQSTAKKGE
ncbi:class I adenylate-forming enzyme family protein [Gordonia humi]|uniref:Long-chain acyl-CoA synthetase n=1 Tax=Gordonia humi TaxID=686429 RepID=A0A840EVK3_9ACTN|nr:AMP-binding protein [Gordonia humi]MBB4134353.1 long-chain acyl-CoA synthetase [Gordonia humi]